MDKYLKLSMKGFIIFFASVFPMKWVFFSNSPIFLLLLATALASLIVFIVYGTKYLDSNYPL